VRMVLAVGRGSSSAPGRSDGLGPLAATLGIGLHRVRLRSGGSGAVQDLGLADLAITDVGQLGRRRRSLSGGTGQGPAWRGGLGGNLVVWGSWESALNWGGLRRRLFSGIG